MMTEETIHDEILSQRLLRNARPIVPSSSAPDLGVLHRRIAIRRQRRRWIHVAAGTVGLASVIAIIGFSVRRRNEPSIANASQRGTISAIDASPAYGTAATLPANTTPHPFPNKREHTITTAAAPFRAFARVRQPIPLFQLDEQTQALHHVGWTSHDEMIPVDVSQLSETQQTTMKHLLHQPPGTVGYQL